MSHYGREEVFSAEEEDSKLVDKIADLAVPFLRSYLREAEKYLPSTREVEKLIKQVKARSIEDEVQVDAEGGKEIIRVERRITARELIDLIYDESQPSSPMRVAGNITDQGKQREAIDRLKHEVKDANILAEYNAELIKREKKAASTKRDLEDLGGSIKEKYELDLMSVDKREILRIVQDVKDDVRFIRESVAEIEETITGIQKEIAAGSKIDHKADELAAAVKELEDLKVSQKRIESKSRNVSLFQAKFIEHEDAKKAAMVFKSRKEDWVDKRKSDLQTKIKAADEALKKMQSRSRTREGKEFIARYNLLKKQRGDFESKLEEIHRKARDIVADREEHKSRAEKLRESRRLRSDRARSLDEKAIAAATSIVSSQGSKTVSPVSTSSIGSRRGSEKEAFAELTMSQLQSIKRVRSKLLKGRKSKKGGGALVRGNSVLEDRDRSDSLISALSRSRNPSISDKKIDVSPTPTARTPRSSRSRG